MDRRIKYLDSFRGIACIIVLIAHIVASDPEIGVCASGCGKIGVWLFMLLSGMFSIIPYLDSNKRLGIKECLQYYKKKIIKIYPTYIIALLATVAIGFIDRNDLWKELTMQQAWKHFWYIPIIIKFYIIVPLFIILWCLIRDRIKCNSEIVFCFTVLIIGGIFAIKYPFQQYVENSISIFWYVPVFCLGIVFATINRIVVIEHFVIFDYLIFIPVCGILAFTPMIRLVLWNIQPSGYLQNKYLYMSVMWFVILLLCSKGKYVKKYLEENAFLQKIGKMSYEIYLFHYIILNFICFHYKTNLGIRAIVTIMATLFVVDIINVMKNIIVFICDSIRNKYCPGIR